MRQKNPCAKMKIQNNREGESTMKIRRKDEIIKLLAENRMMKAGELAEIFQVSMETIRRDLSELEEMKKIRRVHGGAVLNTQYSVIPDYESRTSENMNEKILIAKKAAELVDDGDSIIITSGTTTLEFCKFLKEKKDIKILTNSIMVAYELMTEKDITVLLIGGKVRNSQGVTSGHWAEQMIDDFFVDKLFMGTDGIVPEYGIMDYHMEETNLRRHCIARAKQIVVMADYSKFGVKALNHVCKSEQIDYVVTDEKADKKMLKELRDLGVKVVIA